MPTLVTIGDFSKMTYLTVKALRHYHDIGLLEPIAIDDQNGYRLYGTEQVTVAQTIRRFRELDMSTDDIRTVLDAPSDADRDAVVVAHLERMEARLETTRGTVAGLRMLLDGSVDDPPVSFRTLEPTLAIAIREHVQFSDAEQWCDAAYAELHALLASRAATAAGPDGALYAGAFFEQGAGEIVTFVPVHGDVVTRGRATQMEVPGFEAAIAVHGGAFADLDQTYRTLGTRVAADGIGGPGPIREHYLADDTIEVCWPIAPS